MKNPIGLIALTFMISASSTAQMITKSEGKCGLVDETSKVVLECKYDKVEPYKPGGHTKMAYIYNLNGNFGVLIIDDFINTGLIYDSIYMHDGILTLQSQGKLGYLAEDEENVSHIIEPEYTYLFAMTSSLNRYDNYVNEKSDKIGVKKDSLWGILNYGNGSIHIPVKYQNEVEKDAWNPLYRSVDRKSEIEICINPNTGVEFETTWLATVHVDMTKAIVISTDKYHYGVNGSRQIKIWNYDTGQLLWSYTSHAAIVEATILDGNVVYVREEFDATFPMNKQENKMVYSFYNYTNNGLLLTNTSPVGSQIFIRKLGANSGYEIYVSRTYSGKRKLIGKIFH